MNTPLCVSQARDWGGEGRDSRGNRHDEEQKPRGSSWPSHQLQPSFLPSPAPTSSPALSCLSSQLSESSIRKREKIQR